MHGASARFAAVAGALAACLLAAGCGGGGGAAAKPVVVSLSPRPPITVEEAGNPKVRIFVRVSSTAHDGLTVPLEFSGSATRDRDYAVSAESIVVPRYAPAAAVTIDVFRDFDAEGDEEITISLGALQGNATADAAAGSVSVMILDGEAAPANKFPDEEEDFSALVAPVSYAVTEDSVDFAVFVFPGGDGAATRLNAEWSGARDFSTGVNLLGAVDVPALDPDTQVFLEPYPFSLPLDGLSPNGSYYIRVYAADPETGGPPAEEHMVFFSFATDAGGMVVTSCRAPDRAFALAGPDPLFAEQWHLLNTGQTGFSENPGVAGADLRMREAISAGRGGAGVKLAVVDTGLEICHPDLAANIEEGKSFNFAFEHSAGASLTDPFNHSLLGDHGTSVAGAAAAVADNGLGGRGVAPQIRLRGFNLGGGMEQDFVPGLLLSLGASSSNPDSASADIFNMSFGIEEPAQNSEEDFVQLMKLGTSELRSGRGALYVRAAGNNFSFCEAAHPLNADIGCDSSNSDPDQNLPYLINVGAFNANDVKSSYSSAGANLWVVAPAGEDGAENAGIITTDQMGVEAAFPAATDPLANNHPLNRHGDYTAAFGGTSAAAPAAAGAMAILLGVNPNLSWRDVKHILAASARKIDPAREPVRAAFNGKPYVAQHAWQTNAAGYHYHNWYGFGAIAVDAAVEMAAGHVPGSLGDFAESGWFPADAVETYVALPDADGAGVTETRAVAGLPDWASIEAVILEITVAHTYASDLGVTLTSPSGVESVVNPPFNVVLDEFPGMNGWRLLSNAFYGESPNGEWKLHVADLAPGDTGFLRSWRLRFHYGDHP